MILTIDGVDYDVKCRVRRQGEVRDTDISGEMMDGSYFHDVAGTYYDYEISFLYPLYDQNKYADIYEALTEPVEGHTFILPYNHSTVTLVAKVEVSDDELLELENGQQYWRALRFTLTSNAPTKEPTLDGAITRGRTPLPDIAEPSQGDSYTWNGSEWVVSTTYEDADNIYY